MPKILALTVVVALAVLPDVAAAGAAQPDSTATAAPNAVPADFSGAWRLNPSLSTVPTPAATGQAPAGPGRGGGGGRG
ncbi:hypothetical protein KDM41_13990, partial [bacterium]|nr:hypothetical protein [bacterium]